MKLTPVEQEKLLIFTAGELAKQRKARGVYIAAGFHQLSDAFSVSRAFHQITGQICGGFGIIHPEAAAYLTCYLMEGARDGKSVAELMESGRNVLT
jgi:urease subunit gamma